MTRSWKKGLMKWALVVAVSASTAGTVATSADAGSLPVVKGYCGMQVTQSMRLKNNLTCSDTALRVATDGVILDLDGHTITGAGKGVGIRNDAPFVDDFTARNGIVRGFHTGVELYKVDGVTIKNLTVANSTFANVYLDQVSNSDVVGNTIKKGNLGVRLDDSNSNEIRGNKVLNNGADGIWVKDDSMVNVIKNNVVEGNSDGIDIQDSSGATVTGNTIRYNRADGIHVSTTSGVLIEDNVASWNEDDGIETTDPDTTINGNIANKNGFVNGTWNLVGRGIAANFFTNGSGNSAAGNDDTDCTPVHLCS